MAAVRSDILRCGVRVVCEIMIAELKDMLLKKKRQKLLQMKNGAGHKESSNKVQELLRKKQKIDEERKLARKKMASDSRRKKSGKPQPITLVSVEGMSLIEPTASNEENKSEVILPDDPLGNIQIKQEVEDNEDFTFEEHFEDLILPPIKTEVKDELEYDDLFENKLLDSSSCDTFEDGNLRKKPKLEEDVFDKPTQSGTNVTPEKAPQKLEEAIDVPGPCEKPYVCKICLKRFPTFNDLKKHATLHEIKLMKFHCKKCNLKFATRVRLKDHLNRHARQEKLLPTTVPNMIHSCKICKRGYSSLSLLNKHKHLHKRAKSSATMKIFRKYKINPRNINPLVESKSGRPFKCKYCLKSYRLISELVRHAYIHPHPQRYAYPDIDITRDEGGGEGEEGSILRTILTV